MYSITLEAHNQILPTKVSKPKDVTQEQHVESKKYKDFKNECNKMPGFKDAFDQAEKEQTKKGYTGAELEIKAMDTAYKLLTIKGEHLAPNANTMFDMFKLMTVAKKKGQETLNQTKNHNSYFLSN